MTHLRFDCQNCCDIFGWVPLFRKLRIAEIICAGCVVSHIGAIINFVGLAMAVGHSSIIINKPSRGLCSCRHWVWHWDCVGFSVWAMALALSLGLFYWCHVLFQHKFYGTFYERCWPVLDTADSGGALGRLGGVGRSYISVLGYMYDP